MNSVPGVRRAGRLGLVLAGLYGGPAWACVADADGYFCVPDDLAPGLGLNGAIVSAQALGLTKLNIDPTWTDEDDPCAYIKTAGDWEIRSQVPGKAVTLPGLYFFKGAHKLTDVVLTGYCHADPDGDGSSVSYTLVALEATVVASSTSLVGELGGEVDGAWVSGAAFYLLGARDATVTLSGGSLLGASYPALYLKQDIGTAVLSLQSMTVSGNRAGVLVAERGEFSTPNPLMVSIDSSTFTDNTVPGHYLTSDLWVREADSLTLKSSSFTGQAAVAPGTCVLSEASDGSVTYDPSCSRAVQIEDTTTVTLEDVRFEDYAWTDAAVLSVFNQGVMGTATLTGLQLTNIAGLGGGSYGGGAILSYKTDLDLHGVTGKGLVGDEGALIKALGYGEGPLDVYNVDLQGFTGTAIWTEYLPEVKVRNTSLCDGAPGGSPTLFVYAVESDLQVSNSVFRDSVGGTGVAGIFHNAASHYDSRIVNNTFASSAASYELYVQTQRASSTSMQGAIDLYNNLFTQSTNGVKIAGDSQLKPFVQYNLFWEVSGVPVWALNDTTLYNTVEANPNLWWQYTPGLCSIPPYLGYNSPAIDAGFYLGEPNPAFDDPDGSVADIGAYGGPSRVLPDLDGDGEYAGQDCDDDNVLMGHWQSESPYDGLDNDCDDATPDDDLDGDGYALALDCDDANADLNPGAFDQPEDGIDQDCDGEDAAREDSPADDTGDTGGPDDSGEDPPAPEVRYLGQRLFCATTAGPAQPALLALGALALARRRRRA